MVKKYFKKVVIKGGGDLASGVAHRLHRFGFAVIILELPQPLVVRRAVAFAAAVQQGEIEIEGVKGRTAVHWEQAEGFLQEGVIPVITDPEGEAIKHLKPAVMVDAIMAKKNTGTFLGDAPVVIGLGPGFTAGRDVHAVVETKRGHNLGKVIYFGEAAPNTGTPGEIAGYSRERLLRAPGAGIFKPFKEIGDLVKKGAKIAEVNKEPLLAGIDGMVRGLLFPGLKVPQGMKVGDIDPRGEEADCYTISDKARAVGGGVLEAAMHFLLQLN